MIMKLQKLYTYSSIFLISEFRPLKCYTFVHFMIPKSIDTKSFVPKFIFHFTIIAKKCASFQRGPDPEIYFLEKYDRNLLKFN